MAAAMTAVSALSKLLGAITVPVVLSLADFSSMSILPILPDFISSLSSKSLGKRPSVWPNMAPMTSCFSTTPSTENLTFITYFAPGNFSVSFTYDHLCSHALVTLTAGAPGALIGACPGVIESNPSFSDVSAGEPHASGFPAGESVL
jgi:hypothetical protein